jgi:short-subunit dehydrogenase
MRLRPIELRGKALVITGASSGIGRATAIEAARRGMDLAITARRADRLETLAAEIRSLGRKAVVVAGDVVEPGFSARLLDAAERDLGGFHAVFANAGYGAEKDVLDFTLDELRRMFEVNFFASTDLLREAACRLLAARKPGHLLNCSSCVARFTLPGYGPYAATKAAQALLARSMRYELAPHGIEVSTVHPVTTETEFFEISAGHLPGNAGKKVPDHAPKLFVQPPERVARAVVDCLARPRSEVWTSLLTRLGAGLFTISPRIADLALRNAR